MIRDRRFVVRIVFAFLLVLPALVLVPSGAGAQSKCDAGKVKVVGKMSAAKLNALSKYALKPDDAKLTQSLVKATAKGRKLFEKFDLNGGCLATDDFSEFQLKVDSAVSSVAMCGGIIPSTQGCVCTIQCFYFASTVGTGTGFATDPVQCASLAEEFCHGQIEPKYPNGISVSQYTMCAPIVDGSGCQCTASCEGGALAVDDVTVAHVSECVDLAEAGCGDLDSITSFDCPQNP